MPKVKELRARYPNLHIEVDGGLSPSTIAQVGVSSHSFTRHAWVHP